MMLGKTGTRLGVGVLLAALVGVSLPQAQAAPKHDVTSEVERRRVDTLPAPELNWQSCEDYEGYLCATAKLPLDYDEPDGERIEVALLKVPSSNPEQRVGSLFVNPGGPGGSGKELAAVAEHFLPKEVRDRYDVIGMDPRGIGDSTPLNCFHNPSEGLDLLEELYKVDFPTTQEEIDSHITASARFAEACADDALAASMSTAQVARDMDVLRRAVGDEKLNYLGFSYGSYLGQVYANMFPDRVRALVIDGVINPVEWTGTSRTYAVPMEGRMESAEGADRALRTLFELCNSSTECVLDDPEAQYNSVLARLKKKPVSFPAEDGSLEEVDYARFTTTVLQMLYRDDQIEPILELTYVTDQLLQLDAQANAARKAKIGLRFMKLEQQAEEALEESLVSDEQLDPIDDEGAAWALTQLSGFMSVTCSDAMHPSARQLMKFAPKYLEQYPYFGAAWLWSNTACAAPTWQAKDEDGYRGPFNKHTSAPVLVVGNEFDPATNVYDAVAAADMLPNSQLVLSNNWGHSAYGASQCATKAINSYLIDPKASDEPILCEDGVQPMS